jgi:FixJ family two-component response regulator
MERAARKPVVVVVEDEQLLRMTAIEMVEKAGFEAIEAIAQLECAGRRSCPGS